MRRRPSCARRARCRAGGHRLRAAAARRSTSRARPRRRTSRRRWGRPRRAAPVRPPCTRCRAARAATCSPPRRRRRSRTRRAGASRRPGSRRPASARRAPSRAATIAARSATSPVAICTALNATTSVEASIAPASSAAGTVRTVTPRCAWTRNGKSVEVNSTSGARTRVPSGSDEATRPTSPETVAPTATVDGGTPTSRANDPRAASVASPHCSQLVRPVRQSSSAAWSASQAGRGGSPKLAVLRYVPAGSQSSCDGGDRRRHDRILARPAAATDTRRSRPLKD